MRYLKHPPAAFWALVASALLLLVVLGTQVGREGTPALAPVSTRVEDEQPRAMAVIERVGQINVVSAPPADGLGAWAAETAAMASSAAQDRATVAGATDPVALAYAAIATDAEALSVIDPADAEALLTLKGSIGINRDRLSASLIGIEVPGAPGSPQSVETPDPRDKTLDTIDQTTTGDQS